MDGTILGVNEGSSDGADDSDGNKLGESEGWDDSEGIILGVDDG